MRVSRGGRLDAGQARCRNERIHPVREYAELAPCEIVIEAVFEDLAAKEEVFARLDAAMPEAAVLLTNTSAIDIDLIARGTRRPGAVAGAHFFSPANVMKLLEIVRTDATSDATLAAAMGLGRKLGKVGVVVRNAEGFLTSRSRAPFVSEMVILLEEGALPEQVDRVMVEFGYPMGPFAVSDLAGLDIGHAWRGRRAERDPKFRRLPLADTLVAMGRLGQKTKSGWYRYADDGRTPLPDPEVARVIDDFVAASGRPRRSHSDEEILHRLLFSAVNEACRILAEGLVYRASDIDVAWLHGFGFPRYRGGLLFWATASARRQSWTRSARGNASMANAGHRRPCCAQSRQRAESCATPSQGPRPDSGAAFPLRGNIKSH